MNQFKKERVAIFVASMRGGGAERVMAIVANELAQRGYAVDLLLSQKEGPYLKEIEPNVNIIDLKGNRVLFSLVPLIQYLRKNRPDALLSAVNHVNVIAKIAHLLSNSKSRLVMSQRGAPKVSSNGEVAGKLTSALIRYFYPRADSIIAVSEGVRESLIEEFKIPRSKVVTVNNPLQLERITALAKAEVPHPWIKDKDQPVLIAAGRLNPVKDYSTMIEAFSIVRQSREARLIILGEGELKSALVKKTKELGISDSVDFVGFEANPYAWMSRSDIFLMSSRSEGFPNSLIQAMACGIQIVSTDCEYGPKDILEGQKWGRLVPVGNPELFAEAILATLNDPHPPAVRVRASDFRVEKVIDEYATVLNL